MEKSVYIIPRSLATAGGQLVKVAQGFGTGSKIVYY